MDKDILKKIIFRPERFFPVVALFYALDKQNTFFIFIIALFALFFAIWQDKIFYELIKLVNPDKIKKLLMKNKENEAKEIIFNKIFSPVKKDWSVYVFILISELFLIIYSIYVLIPLFKLYVAKFLIVIGCLGLLKLIKIHFVNLIKSFKIVIKSKTL